MLYHWATGDFVVRKGQIVGIDWNRIARLHSHVLALSKTKWKIYCYDHSSLSSTTAVQIWIISCLLHINSIWAISLRRKQGRRERARNRYSTLILNNDWMRFLWSGITKVEADYTCRDLENRIQLLFYYTLFYGKYTKPIVWNASSFCLLF